jgi:cell division protein FtsI/penicillin-binding protein 2
MKKIYTYRKFFHRFTILTKEQKMLGFFVFLLILLRIRLFFLQAIYTAEYQKDLIDIHATKSTLNANRGHIYTVNKG